jgi:ADP-ribosylglycohydrolase
MQPDFDRVLALDVEDPANQPAAQDLLDKTILLPTRPGHPFDEPSDLEGIKAARPSNSPKLPSLACSTDTLLDKFHGAWTGRVAGCLLGKPIEGLHRKKLWGYLKDAGLWPLSDYLRAAPITVDAVEHAAILKKHAMSASWNATSLADRIDSFPEDDDINYTTTALLIMQRHGPGFTPEDVANLWLQELSILHTCTAARVAYRNFCALIGAPESASFRNPYREWIGAQIRADFFGYAAAGNPELAADFAWRDASISHVKNGIYGAMWSAAMNAAAFVTANIQTIIRAGLGQIPSRCRLAESIEAVLAKHSAGVGYDDVVEWLHAQWDENRAHDWCHTISNAIVVAIGLLWGEADYAKTICRAVQPCFDTDCNGATCGSILGAVHGHAAIPGRWKSPFNDSICTGIHGYGNVKLSDIARDTLGVHSATLTT